MPSRRAALGQELEVWTRLAPGIAPFARHRVAGVRFVPFSGSEFVQMFLGADAARVQELFERTRERAPCLLFIDDLELIRRACADANGAREPALEQMLLELERLASGVEVVAATSEATGLDEAWRRPGRFEHRLVLLPPGAAAREAIARTHAVRLRCAPDVDFSSLAQRTAGLLGADLVRLLNEAGRTAARRRAPAVTAGDIDAALLEQAAKLTA